MLKKQWDKLPIGTVLLYYDAFDEDDVRPVDSVEVKINKNIAIVVWFIDDERCIGNKLNYKNNKDYQLSKLELAPKWIQELFKIK